MEYIDIQNIDCVIFGFQDVSKKNERCSINEVHLVIMRLLSVFMSRTKSGSKSSSEVTVNIAMVISCSQSFVLKVKIFILNH